MIVKDEEPTLARCLNCTLAFADEIIIVDTGSSDLTVEIARGFTVKLYFFEWCDDFSAARNFSFSKAGCDLVMWLDADDVITEENAAKINSLKKRGGFDTAMLRYASAFDGDKPTFVYFRERIFNRALNVKWEGAVHEAVTPVGKVIYSDACIFHKKVKEGEPMRNLSIFQRRICRGELLSAREKFYYGRELYFNGMLIECIAVLTDFLNGGGWVENEVDACRILYRANMALGREYAAINALLYSFSIAFPHAEDCCILGEYFERKNDLRSAVYWYESALRTKENAQDGGFINVDFLQFIPAIRLCVLYDKAGDIGRAVYYNELAGAAKPDNASYLYNKEYFKTKSTEG